MMQVLPVSFAAGQTKRFEVAGRYLEIISSAGPVNIDLYDQYGADANGAANVLSGFFVECDFSSFNIRSATAQTVELLITDGRGGSRRQPGTVRVIDSGVDNTQAGRQYLQSNAGGASAGNVTAVCINAAGANVAIKRLFIGSDVAGDVLIGFATSPGTANPSQAAMQNKKMGSSSSVCRLGATSNVMTSANPTAAQVPGYAQFARLYLQANQTLILPFTDPLVITGTQGLVVQGAVLNRALSVAFEVEEF